MTDKLVKFIRELYGTNEFIPLPKPVFSNLEKIYLSQAIDSGYVSSVGKEVIEFEEKISRFVGVKHAVAVNNGTSALHVALRVIGARENTEIITQSLTFVATCNAIKYCNAEPVFVDVSKETMGLCPLSLNNFLEEHCEVRNDGRCWNKLSKKEIVACLPMHTYGFPVKLKELNETCSKFNIPIIEDAAESLGSKYYSEHVGRVGKLSTLSFNGNKIITSGGGGMILTNDDKAAEELRHLTTTAKLKHDWLFDHDKVGYNYRMPNINAALGIAQLNKIDQFIKNKREIAIEYQKWGHENSYYFFSEPDNTISNYWLNTLILDDIDERENILRVTNDNKIMTRPAWTPMHQLEIYKNCFSYNLKNTKWFNERIVNVPSSVNFYI